MVTGGTEVPTLTADEVHARRKVAVAWLEYWCGWPPGEEIAKTDPRYIDCTEGRDRTPAQQRVYSSCADLAHGMLYRVGVRLPWLNRDEHRGWKSSVNVSRLVSHSQQWDRRKLEGGDTLMIANQWPSGKDAHVVCVIDEQPDSVQLTPDVYVPIEGGACLSTAQYGASGMRVGGIGGRLQSYDAWDRLHIGSRRVRVVLPFADVLLDAFQKGLLEPPQYPPATYAGAP